MKDHPAADKSKHQVQKSIDEKPESIPESKSESKPESESESESESKSKSKSKIPPHKKVKPSKKSVAKIQKVLKQHDLSADSDEVKEMMGFKQTLGQRIPEAQYGQFYVRNEKKLKSDFISNMKSSNYASNEAFQIAKKRMQEMPVSDFGKILGALTDDTDE